MMERTLAGGSGDYTALTAVQVIFSLKRGHIVRLSLPPPPHFRNAQVRRADTGAPLSDLSSTFLIEVHLASFMCVTMRGLGIQSSHRGSQTREGR